MRPPRKPRLGQNFLIDERARYAIVDALGDLRQRTVIEIGPGHGAITELLAARAKRVIAIELDRALAAELRFRLREQPQVEIVEADVLATDLAALPAEGEPFDVIGNLPYYITSEILLELYRVARAGQLERAVLMMQREVADRVTAAPGVRDYGLLSATTRLAAQTEMLFTLPPTAFNPPPDVVSAVVRFHFAAQADALGVDLAGFDRFLKLAFAQKRKTLANNLRAAGYSLPALQSAWPAQIAPLARAESLDLEAMAAFYRALPPL